MDNYYSQNKKKADGTPYIYYHLECKECAIEKAKQWALANPEQRKLLKNKYEKKPKSKEQKKLREKGYREDGKYLDWQRENKDKIRGYNKEREQHKKHEISKSEWLSCKSYFNNCCAYCGLSVEKHFRIHYGEMKQFDLHKEHVDHNGSNDLSNCVPSCQSCNSSKWTYSLLEWYTPEKEFYNEDRLSKIHNWLSVDFLKFKE